MVNRYTIYRTIVMIFQREITIYHFGFGSRKYKWKDRPVAALIRRCMELWKAGRAFPDLTKGITFGIDPIEEVTNENRT